MYFKILSPIMSNLRLDGLLVITLKAFFVFHNLW